MLTHLFTPDQCAACKLCCHFHRTSAWETPALEPQTAQSLRTAGVPLDQRADGSCSFRLNFATESADETADCPMLDPARGCTMPRSERPFECRIWPLRLMRDKQGKLVLGLYDACPALTPPVRDQLIAEATGPLLPILLEHAERRPHVVRPVDPAYSIISPAVQE